MARQTINVSTTSIPMIFEPQGSNPVDARLTVASKSDLTITANTTVWKVSGEATNVYQGMQVYVVEDKATYMFVGDADKSAGYVKTSEVANANNWVKVADSTNNITKIDEKINGLSGDSITSLSGSYTKADENLVISGTTATGKTITTSISLSDLSQEYTGTTAVTSADTASHNVGVTVNYSVSGKSTISAEIDVFDCGEF